NSAPQPPRETWKAASISVNQPLTRVAVQYGDIIKIYPIGATKESAQSLRSPDIFALIGSPANVIRALNLDRWNRTFGTVSLDKDQIRPDPPLKLPEGAWYLLSPN